MLSAPANPIQALSQPPQKFVILLGPEDGTAPAANANEVQYLIPQRFSITAGGGRDDVMVFNVDLSKMGQRLVDTSTPTGLKRQVEIRGLDDQGKPTNVLAWGFLSKNPQSIDAESESTMFEARITSHHFGKPLTTYPIWMPSGARLDLNRELVFNPEIDEIIEPNKSSKTDAAKGWSYVVDPESLRTLQSRTYQQQSAALWKLSDAVFALCWWLNGSETYIKNPTLVQLQKGLADRDTMLKNVSIPLGAMLPSALDQLLTPFEYGWYLRHSLTGADRVTTIQLFPRGKGAKKQVLLQRPGEKRDIKKTNVSEFSVEYDINQLANRIEAYGGFVRVEASFELKKAWPTVYDSTDLAELEKGQPTAETHPSVGRKWVLNEAGDYTLLRPEITAPYDLSTLMGESQSVRRRRFLRCLTQHNDADDLESNGFRVDWYDEDQTGATDPSVKTDPGWIRVKWPFAVLEKECGIFWEGAEPPGQLWSYMKDGHPEKARVRITATIVGDMRVKGVATRRDKSPNGLDVPLVLDLHDRFQKGSVDASSIFDTRSSTARDDTPVIQTYVESVRDIEDAMKMHASILLEGVSHPEYQIGDLIDNVAGRNLSLNGYDPSGGADSRNPQIVGMVYHLAGGQRMELLLDSFERERPTVVMDNHQSVLS